MSVGEDERKTSRDVSVEMPRLHIVYYYVGCTP